MSFFHLTQNRTMLEDELRFLFGGHLRAAGGDGVLPMKDYLAAVGKRAGPRAIVLL
jgi:hypothetical protein